MVMDEDMCDGNVQCTNHPYQNSSPSGICAFCLQEKLGKLVSSSFPSFIFPSSTPSNSSPSFRSNFVNSSVLTNTSSSQNGCYKSMSKPPLVLSNKNNAKNLDIGFTTSNTIPFNRSKSVATPSRGVMHLLDENYAEDYSPRRRKFWSFLHLTSKKNYSKHFTSAMPSLKREEFVVVEENGVNSPNEACFDGKVSRSRSVGCGSRSFSLGDCSTLRRVESQREGSTKMSIKNSQDCGIKERVECGGIFNGFMITSSSSNWESNMRRMSAVHSSFPGHVSSHGRSKSWGWALASPMRAFSKPSSVKRGDNSRKNQSTPDLNAIPSLLSV